MGRATKMLAASALSVVALAGCGSSGGGATAASGAKSSVLDPTALVAASYTKVSAQKTAKLSLSFALTSAKENLSFDGSGIQDFQNKKADLVINDPSGQKIEERLLGTTIYVKLPTQASASSPALKGKTWLKEDLTKAAQAAGLGSGDTGQNSDPSQILQMLGSVSDQVTTVGPEQVRGVDTTHYHVVVDLTKAATKQGSTPAQATRLRQLLGTNTMPVDLWIDHDGLPHRLQFQMPLPKTLTQQGGLTGAKLMATEELYDFGTPVSVDAPPASETADALALQGSTGSGGTGTTTHA